MRIHNSRYSLSNRFRVWTGLNYLPSATYFMSSVDAEVAPLDIFAEHRSLCLNCIHWLWNTSRSQIRSNISQTCNIYCGLAEVGTHLHRVMWCWGMIRLVTEVHRECVRDGWMWNTEQQDMAEWEERLKDDVSLNPAYKNSHGLIAFDWD